MKFQTNLVFSSISKYFSFASNFERRGRTAAYLCGCFPIAESTLHFCFVLFRLPFFSPTHFLQLLFGLFSLDYFRSYPNVLIFSAARPIISTSSSAHPKPSNPLLNVTVPCAITILPIISSKYNELDLYVPKYPF